MTSLFENFWIASVMDTVNVIEEPVSWQAAMAVRTGRQNSIY
jgi:hypothetical protein